MTEPDWSTYDADERHDPACPRSNARGRQRVACECPKISQRVRDADAGRRRRRDTPEA